MTLSSIRVFKKTKSKYLKAFFALLLSSIHFKKNDHNHHQRKKTFNKRRGEKKTSDACVYVKVQKK
jgi:hypothetical protein